MPPNRPKNIMPTRKRLSPGRRKRRGRGRLKRHMTSLKTAHDTSERTSLPTSALKPRRAQIVRRNDRPAAQMRPKDSASAASNQSSNDGRWTPTAQAVPLRAKQALRKTNDYSYPADGGCGRTGPSRRAGSCATAECGHRWSDYNPKSHLWGNNSTCGAETHLWCRNPTCVPARCSRSAESRAVALRESASAKMRAGRQMSSSQSRHGRRVPAQMWAL